jgi:ferric-dicitrate binding protein FerR (iron transport regulator)
MSGEQTQRLADMVADAARSGIGQMSSEQLDQGWQRLESALDQGKGPSLPVVLAAPRWWLRGLLAAAAALVLGLGGYRLLPSRATLPLHYVVEGASLGPNETVEAGPVEPARLVFSDRSEVSATPATKVRVLALDAHGARVALADGALDVRVEHRRDASWRFEAGPFSVRVKGTSFRLTYDARSGRFAVQMEAGVVEVRGPSADRAFTLRDGESIELFAVPEGKPAAAPVALPAVEPAAPVKAESVPAKPGAEPTRPSPPPARRRLAVLERGETGPEASGWARLIARGEFATVVRQAEERGLDATMANASAAELTSLADAARYTRRNALARQALLSVRARFPGTTRASDAAFFLGRLAEPSSGSAQALTWYQTYLAESSDGPYAGEVLGREIVLLARTDRAAARKVARTYLERFPRGTQAELAKSLVESRSE